MGSPTFDALWLGTAGNTILRFPIPSHTDGTKAVVSVTIRGDRTPVPAPPAGWTEQTAAYDANADTTFVVWTHDNLPAATTTIDVTWTPTAVAAGTVLVSVDSQSILSVEPVTVVLGVNVATAAAGVTAGYPVIVGGTADGDPKLEPVTDATYTQAEWNDEQQTGVDAWVLWSNQLLAVAAGVNEIQRISSYESSGTFTLTFDGQTTAAIAWDADAATIQAALEALSNIGAGNVSVTEGPLDEFGTEVAVEFIGALAAADQPLITSSVGPYVDGENEVQRVTSDRTGGTFTLTFDGQTTGAINWDASNAQMQTALEALSNINGVICTGGPLPGAIDVEFIANNSETDVPEMTVTDSGTGGTAVTVSTITNGFPDSGQELYVDTEGAASTIPDQNYTLDGTGNEAGGAAYTTSQLILFEAAANTGPQVYLNTPNPAAGCVADPVTIAGYSTSEIGVDTVDVEIIRASDGLYWDGGAWVAGPVSNAATLGTPGGQTTTFTFDASGAFTQAGSYTIQVTATDLDAPPIATARAITACVAGPTAVQLSRSGTRLGDGGNIMVEVVGRPNGVSPGVVLARLPVVKEQSYFTRQLDSTSEAEVLARYSPLDLRRCCDVVGAIETYAHEIRIWWDGIPAWVGPITHTRHLVDGIHIRAADRTVHWETRVIGGHTHDNVPLSTIFADYHRDAYAQDPFDLTVVAQDANINGSRLVLDSDGMVAERALSELSRTALDWTCVGTQLLIGGQEVPTRAVPTLTDEHFTAPLEVVEDGTLRSTDFVMTGGNNINDTTTNAPVSGRATLPESDPRRRRYGLITGRSQDSKIIDQESINAAARTRLEFGQDPVYIDAGEAVLRPTAPVQMVDLIPGARIDAVAAATCRVVAAKFRLWRVKADLNGRVSVQFQPLGTVTPGTL